MSADGRIMIGVSGGVDSSVAALLLTQSGAAVEGLFMQNWEEDDRLSDCHAEEDRRDAVAVCGRLGIPFHSANFAAEYWDQVFRHFLDEYRAGRTPNPDVLCNREIKFRSFLDHARALGADHIATGHYARVDEVDGRWRLLRGIDNGKDQSYFLHALDQEQLRHTRFPIGELPKAEVRRLAQDAGLPTHAKKDSTGICFIGERDFREFLGQYLPAQAGEMRALDGTVIGEHAGSFYYTLGQREGLNIGGVRGRDAAPWYVVGKDVSDNVLWVDQGHDSPALLSTQLVTEAATWVAGSPPSDRFEASAKTRYRQPDQHCRVEVRDDGGIDVRFSEPQRAVTPGQSLVLYHGDECLGGAVIAASNARFGGLPPDLDVH
ncbi:MAG TPA: tRNA 2-thiouridine(34) synthase MnmA [Xanthomonadaceae bacterium]|nr:tRNA 2-thiouridine(34) synthase MnmA [Xanthomonadaceae bacterium]HRX98614.1 tRNA 2-thiouridine(34) synthase MnmA [Xanthomonadaceae bacterium]